MSVLINLIGLFLLLILLLGMILLFSPLKYNFYLNYKGNLSVSLSAKITPLIHQKLLFNNYRLITTLRILGIKLSLPGGKSKEKNKEKEGEIKGKGFPFSIELLTKENLMHFIELLYDLYRIFRPQKLWVSGRVGFSEPHHTAWLQACLSTLPVKMQGTIEPVWDEECLEVEVNIAGSIRLSQVLLRAIKFLLSKKTRQIWAILKKTKEITTYMQPQGVK